MKVALGVLTFQRPVGLRRALESIGRLELPVDNSSEVEVVVVVVDNDAGRVRGSGGPGDRSLLPVAASRCGPA